MKYQTLVARPEIGNRFICAAGCSSLLSPSLPLQGPDSAELEQMQPRGDRAPHLLPGALPSPVSPCPPAYTSPAPWAAATSCGPRTC